MRSLDWLRAVDHDVGTLAGGISFVVSVFGHTDLADRLVAWILAQGTHVRDVFGPSLDAAGLPTAVVEPRDDLDTLHR